MTRTLGALGLAVALLAAAAVQAEPLADCPRGARAGRAGRLFDATKLTTIQADVIEIQRVARRRGAGVHLLVASGSERLPIHLGPAAWLDRQPLQLAAGDRIEVKGARVTVDGAPVVLAQEIRRGADVLALRDGDGAPLWRAQR